VLGSLLGHLRAAIVVIFLLALAQTQSAEQTKLRDGDEVAARGTDELRPGVHVPTKQVPAETETRK